MLNVLPWGHPALTELYLKISGKTWSHCGIPINAAVITDLMWLKNVIPSAIGICFTDQGMWSDDNADMVMWTDVSLRNALSFVYSNKGFLYPIKPLPVGTKVDIFFLEHLAIASAVHHAGSLVQPPHHILIWTDSLDSVAVLNSLCTAKSLHNAPLLAISDIILQTGMDLRVHFIEGKKNVHANMLSHLLIDKYQSNSLLTASNALLLCRSFCWHDGESTFECTGGEMDHSMCALPPHGVGRSGCLCTSFAGELY